jgi:hypothetical protein
MKKEEIVNIVIFGLAPSVLLAFVSCTGHIEVKCSKNLTGKMMNPQNQISQFQDKQTVFFILKNGAMCTTKDNFDPETLYVKGSMENGQFIVDVKNGVQGDGPLSQSGRQGWLEICSGEFFPDETGKAPVSPYVNGYMTNEGFIPSSKIIR